MSVLVLVLGVVATLTGIASIGFGIPNGESTVGNAAIIAGTTMFIGGLLLIGLAAVIGQLRRINDNLSAQVPGLRTGRGEMPDVMPAHPVYPERAGGIPEAPASAESPPIPARIPFPARPSPRMPQPEPQPVPEQFAEEPQPQRERAPVDFSTHAIERMRSNISRAGQRPPEPATPAAAPAPFVRQGRMPPFRNSNGAVPTEGERSYAEPPPEPDYGEPDRHVAQTHEELPTAAEPEPAEQRARPGMFDSLWPPEPRSAKPRTEEPANTLPPMAPPRVGPSRHERETEPAPYQPPHLARAHPDGAPRPPDRPPGGGDPQAVAILKSGVVDGMAYTLFTDGSIEAQLASGTVRFASISELRSHLDQHSQS